MVREDLLLREVVDGQTRYAEDLELLGEEDARVRAEVEGARWVGGVEVSFEVGVGREEERFGGKGEVGRCGSCGGCIKVASVFPSAGGAVRMSIARWFGLAQGRWLGGEGGPTYSMESQGFPFVFSSYVFSEVSQEQ